MGNVSAAIVRVGELFRDAVRIHAAGVILVHNHPSGDPEPSPDDLHLTAEADRRRPAARRARPRSRDRRRDGYVSLRDRGVASTAADRGQ